METKAEVVVGYAAEEILEIAAKEDDFADFRAGKRGLLHHFAFNVGVGTVRDCLVFGLDSAGCRQYPKQLRFIVCLLAKGVSFLDGNVFFVPP